MPNIFYKITYTDYHHTSKYYTTYDLIEATKFYNTMNQTSGVFNVKFFIVNNVEEELTKEQLPILNNKS